jgi:antitoxin component of MazEF toxin-antitoxin module
MRLHKVVNRVYEGTTYYRWVVAIPPKNVRELGWVDGQELETVVRGSSLWVQPSIRPRPNPKGRRAEAIEESMHARSMSRH